MGLGCGSSLIKLVLFVFNLLCVLGGIAFIAVGAIIISKAEDLKDAIKDYDTNSVPITLIAIGVIIFVVAFFGCCGAVRESECMTMTYAFFLFVILVAQIVIAVLVFLYKDDFNKAIQDGVRNIFDNKSNMEAIDTIQRTLECCGSEGPQWWTVSLPPSCCKEPKLPTCTIAESYQRGCIAALKDNVRAYSNYIGYGVLIVAAVELLGVIFACCLATSIRNERRSY